MHPDAVELARLEIEAHQFEARLEHELDLAREKADAVTARLVMLQAFAQDAGEEPPRLALPRMSFDDAARERALEARRAVLDQRVAAAQALQASIDALITSSAELEESLSREAERLACRQREREQQQLETQPKPPAPVREQSPRVVLCTEVGNESNSYSGFTTDISETGIVVASVMTPAPGSLVDVRFTLPGGNLIEATGMVRWTRSANDEVMPGVGIQFLALAPHDAAAISAFVAQPQ